jgi:N-carbamoyl-L-amino-acid hydrolase
MATEFSRNIADAISQERLLARIQNLAGFGARGDGGVDRQALGEAELAARRWLVSDFALRPGYRIMQDAAANLFLHRDGADNDALPVLTGSHIDTQAPGGKLDGAFGVCAGLEVFDALDSLAAKTLHPVEVVIWNNEEGVRFSPGLMGSSAFVAPERLPALREIADRQEVSFGTACDLARQDMWQAALQDGWRIEDCTLARSLAAYVEAHIEQGPILENLGLSVGSVQSIQAVRWRRVVVDGRCAHAGTTPRALRDDAMAKAIRLAQQILDLEASLDDPDLRLTIGRWSVRPDAINTIADQVCFTLDMRHPDQVKLDHLEAHISEFLPATAYIESLLDKPTVYFDAHLQDLTHQAFAQLGITQQRLFSGAFHDAVNLAAHCPTAMLFAPSHAGISHHPDEYTPGIDLLRCTQVLAFCLGELALPA